jgi:hypothetical protein
MKHIVVPASLSEYKPRARNSLLTSRSGRTFHARDGVAFLLSDVIDTVAVM